MKNLLLAVLALFSIIQVSAQMTVTGTVANEEGEPLIGVNIQEKGTIKGTVTDFDGRFTMEVASAEAVLIFSYVGYETMEAEVDGRAEFNVVMVHGISLGEVQVVGSRSYQRSSTDAPVPIDIIDVAELAEITGKVEINQILQYAAPSFNATN